MTYQLITVGSTGKEPDPFENTETYTHTLFGMKTLNEGFDEYEKTQRCRPTVSREFRLGMWLGGLVEREVRVIRAAELIREVIRLAGWGGALHMVIEDENLDDEDLEYCRKLVEERRGEMGEESYQAQKRCGEALAALTEWERHIAVERARETNG